MSDAASSAGVIGVTARDKRSIHPVWLRLVHWVNAIAVAMMVTSGWQIYNASPLFPWLHFPMEITLGGWLAGALLWHFAAMWLLVANFLVYVVLGLGTGRFSRMLLPLSARGFGDDLLAALRGSLEHEDLSRYNMLQKIAYLAIILDIALLIASGLSIWKPVQFETLCNLFGGYDTARFVHFYAMAFLVCFFAIHLIMSLLVPRSLLSMLRGR